MAINRKLLPIKAHFFFSLAGAAPVYPFIPLIIKELGFSATITGIINTIVPVLCMAAKPLAGSIADKFKIHKYLLIFLILSSAAVMMSLRLLSPLPMHSHVDLVCDPNSTHILIHTSKANDECFVRSLSSSLNNTRLECQFLAQHHQGKFIDALGHNETMNGTGSDANHSDERLVSPTQVNLENGRKQDENTIALQVKTLAKNFHVWSLPSCEGEAKMTGSLHCPNPLLHEIVTEVRIPDDEVVRYHQFWYLLLIILGVRVIGSCCENLTDSVCFKLLKENPYNYGMQRMWGAAGWGLVSAVSGYLVDIMSEGKATSDRSIGFYLSAALIIVDAIICLTCIKVNDDSTKKRTANIWSNVGKLLGENPKFLVFLMLVVSCGIFNSLLWNFLFWFIEEIAKEDGCGDNSKVQTLNGLVLAVNCYLGEMPFFFFSGWFLKKIGYEHCMSLVLIAFGIRFVAYYFLTNPWWILPIEVLNGFTFGLFYSTMTTYANALTPPGLEGTMQGLVSATFEGIGLAAGSLLGGYLFDRLGGRTLFLYSGAASIFLAAAHCLLVLNWMTSGVSSPPDADEDSDDYHAQDIMRISPGQHNNEEEFNEDKMKT
uniref:Major facilitator superfamily (MFS) profile domain-containing protein n=2 Tax=Lygus hesperus TaxID=30085 RepID=A0A0K8T4A4_LYGHE